MIAGMQGKTYTGILKIAGKVIEMATLISNSPFILN
jgi:hypothetical protein